MILKMLSGRVRAVLAVVLWFLCLPLVFPLHLLVELIVHICRAVIESCLLTVIVTSEIVIEATTLWKTSKR